MREGGKEEGMEGENGKIGSCSFRRLIGNGGLSEFRHPLNQEIFL